MSAGKPNAEHMNADAEKVSTGISFAVNRNAETKCAGKRNAKNVSAEKRSADAMNATQNL